MKQQILEACKDMTNEQLKSVVAYMIAMIIRDRIEDFERVKVDLTKIFFNIIL